MGKEIITTPVRIKKFLGMNNKISDTSIDLMEAASLQNVNITEESLDQRGGSTKLNTVAFKDKTDTTAKSINGLYETQLNGNTYRVGTGGDAFKQYTGGAFVDKTGSVTITDDDDNLSSFATFFDGSGTEIVITAFESANPPIKWTGTGDAVILATPPGNFKFPIVHKNKLWVVIDDIVYYSALLNGESWDIVWDLARFRGDGEDITGLAIYADRVVVFKPSSIHFISGSSSRDLYIETVVTGDGCASGYSIQEVESRRYGNILIFLSSEGIIKGFNGTKNLLLLGDPVKPLYDTMNRGRLKYSTSANYLNRNQYWLSMAYGSGSTQDRILIYDYFNDVYSDSAGRALSSNLYHIGIKANAMATFSDSASKQMIVTGDYSGFALRQDYGLLDEAATAITSIWRGGKIDFGAPSHIKMITDLNVVTTQKSETHLRASMTTTRTSGTAAATISTGGSKWGTMTWGTDKWSAPDTKYTRLRLTPDTGELAVAGRYIIPQLYHNTASEAMIIEELIIGVTDLGLQPEYSE